MKKRIILTIIVCLSVQALASQDSLRTSPGSRATGMGGAAITCGETSEAIFYNWAAPTSFKKPIFKLDQGKALEFPMYSFSIQNLSDVEGLRLSYTYFSIGDIERSTLNDRNQPVLSNETFTNKSQTLYASQYWKVGTYHVGVRGNFYYENLDNSTAYSAGLDLALHKETNIKTIPIQWGLTAANYVSTPLKWSTGHNDTLPKLLTVGMSTTLTPKWTLAIDWPFADHTLQPLHIGTEYWMLGDWHSMPTFALRAGILGKDMTVGVGIHSGLIFDYAIVIPNDSFRSIEHRFSIAKSFDPFSTTPEQDEESTPKNTPLSFTKLTTTLSSLALNTEPKLIFSFQSSINPNDDSLFFWCDTLPENTKCNAKAVVPNATYQYPFPITFFAPVNTKQSVLVTIDSGPEETITITGYVPSGIIPIIDGGKTSISKDGRFESVKSLQKDALDLSIQLIQK